MDTWQSAVFQVVEADRRRVLGTAFSIFGGRVLTCRHVLNERDKIQVKAGSAQPLFNYRSVYLFRSVDRGLVQIAEWALHDQYDIACGRLADGATPLEYIPLQTGVVMPSTVVTCAGFPASGADTLVSFNRNVAGQSHQGLILDGALAPGVSGGPALVSGRAIGVVYADILNESVTLLTPLNAISNWIERALPPIAETKSSDFGLSAVPIAGSLRPHEIPLGVIRVFSREFDDRNVARQFFNGAMLLRAKHNPEGFSEDQILVRLQEISWDSAPEAFWNKIFELCARRSQRTVAALFFADDAPQPEFLQLHERTIFEQFRSRLMH